MFGLLGSVRLLPGPQGPIPPRTTLTWSDRCRSYWPSPSAITFTVRPKKRWFTRPGTGQGQLQLDYRQSWLSYGPAPNRAMGGGPARGIAITLHRIQRYIRLIDLHGGFDVSMLLLRYAGMADLYTGAVQRRVTTIPGSAAGHSASRSTAAPGTALSWTCRHRACPRTMQPAARRLVPAAECSRRSRPDRCARRARHQPLVYMRWPVSSPRARASECAASPVRAVPMVSCP
jgi:hypothetical protein